MRFRKKPVEIEARQVTDENITDLLKWIDCRCHVHHRNGVPTLVISTLEGNMEATPSDWIIRGVEGEFYPCMDSIFKATYEPAGEAA